MDCKADLFFDGTHYEITAFDRHHALGLVIGNISTMAGISEIKPLVSTLGTEKIELIVIRGARASQLKQKATLVIVSE